MKKQMICIAGTALLATAILSLTSCSTTEGSEDIAAIETPSGAIIVDTITATATVTAIDPATRKVTLVTAGGTKTTYKAGPEVANFDQIEVGDQVKVKVTEEAAIYIGSGAPPSEVATADVALAPVGAKPGGALVDTVQITARVIAVDPRKHRVTFELPDGSTKKVKVGKGVDLSSVRPGDNVTVQVSEGLAIWVEKP